MSRGSAVFRPINRYRVPIVLFVVVVWIGIHDHFGGVDWGDDFALYLHQAKALTLGNIGEVVAANRYAIDNSGWHSFSPVAYPWGWPLLMAPVYMVFGLNYEVLKALEVLAFATFLVTFYAVLHRRLGSVQTLLLVLLFAASPIFNGATDSLLSDLPYMCFVGVTLWWLDTSRVRGILADERWRLIVLGLLIAFTFNIRREGVTLVIALVALHVAVLIPIARRGLSTLRTEVDWRRVWLPYVAFLGSAAAFQLLLPTTVLPQAPGTALSNIPHRLSYYQGSLAEQIGLKQAGAPMELFHSYSWAQRAVLVVAILAIVGAIARVILKGSTDVALAAYGFATAFVMLISPFQEPRYMYTISPLAVYFAFQALRTGAELLGTRRAAARWFVLVPALAVVALTLTNARHLGHALKYHHGYHYTVDGPANADSKAMIATVRDMTRGDDVILFFRARAMNFYTDRLAVQGSDLATLLKRVDWYVMEKHSTYSQTLVSPADAPGLGLTQAWENGSWVLWHVTPHA